jgi:hypothetical protein
MDGVGQPATRPAQVFPADVSTGSNRCPSLNFRQ